MKARIIGKPTKDIGMCCPNPKCTAEFSYWVDDNGNMIKSKGFEKLEGYTTQEYRCCQCGTVFVLEDDNENET